MPRSSSPVACIHTLHFRHNRRHGCVQVNERTCFFIFLFACLVVCFSSSSSSSSSFFFSQRPARTIKDSSNYPSRSNGNNRWQLGDDTLGDVTVIIVCSRHHQFFIPRFNWLLCHGNAKLMRSVAITTRTTLLPHLNTHTHTHTQHTHNRCQ